MKNHTLKSWSPTPCDTLYQMAKGVNNAKRKVNTNLTTPWCSVYASHYNSLLEDINEAAKSGAYQVSHWYRREEASYMASRLKHDGYRFMSYYSSVTEGYAITVHWGKSRWQRFKEWLHE